MTLKKVIFKRDRFSDGSASWINASIEDIMIGGYENKGRLNWNCYIFDITDTDKIYMEENFPNEVQCRIWIAATFHDYLIKLFFEE